MAILIFLSQNSGLASRANMRASPWPASYNSCAARGFGPRRHQQGGFLISERVRLRGLMPGNNQSPSHGDWPLSFQVNAPDEDGKNRQYINIFSYEAD
jgi:hypothetical protein